MQERNRLRHFISFQLQQDGVQSIPIVKYGHDKLGTACVRPYSPLTYHGPLRRYSESFAFSRPIQTHVSGRIRSLCTLICVKAARCADDDCGGGLFAFTEEITRWLWVSQIRLMRSSDSKGRWTNG